jgi:hypothetical protein
VSATAQINTGIILAVIVFIAVLVVLVVLSVKFKTFGKAIGAILSVVGLAAVVYGIVRSNSFESQFISAFGVSDDTITLCFILGGISLVLGIILLIVGFSGKKTPVYNVQAPAMNNMNVNAVKVRCPKCQALNDESSRFCKTCGNPLTSQRTQF